MFKQLRIAFNKLPTFVKQSKLKEKINRDFTTLSATVFLHIYRRRCQKLKGNPKFQDLPVAKRKRAR